MQADLDQQTDTRMQLTDDCLRHIPDLLLKAERRKKSQQLLKLHPAELINIFTADRHLQPLLLEPGTAALRADLFYHTVLDEGRLKCLSRGGFADIVLVPALHLMNKAGKRPVPAGQPVFLLGERRLQHRHKLPPRTEEEQLMDFFWQLMKRGIQTEVVFL
ncbi:hypothetical protein D3C75_403900 [compost metagenome]